MKLFTKDIDKKLFQQYQNGSDLDSQVAVAKIFNPYGNGRWFLLNSDPQDPDYLWAIVQMGDVVEVGSVLRSELESVRVSPFKLPLERDLGFTMKNASEVYRGLLEGKFYQKGGSLMAARGMEVGRYYKDKNGDTYRYIGENSQRQTLFNDGQKVIVKSIDDFEEKPTEKKLFGFFENGGETEDEGVDLFEDYDNIPHNVQVILVKYTDAFEDGSYNALAKAKKELEDIGYTFEYGLGGGAYDLRKLGQKGKNADDYADGGFVEKTDDELKGMSDDELFEYLDAKAAYMKQYARPLSSFKAKNYAANTVAIQFQNEGTDKLDANFPSLSKINQQATKDYEETIAKRNKMAMGGEVKSELWNKIRKISDGDVFYFGNPQKVSIGNYKDIKPYSAQASHDGDISIEFMQGDYSIDFKNTITERKENRESFEKYSGLINVSEPLNKKLEKEILSKVLSDKMAMGGVIKVGDTIKIKDGLKGKLMNVEGKNLEVKKITEYEFPSGIRKFYHVEDDGYVYDVREDLVEHKKMADGGMFATMEQVMTFEEFKKKLPILHDMKAGDNGVEYKPKYNKYSDSIMYFKHGRTNSEKVSLSQAYKHYKYFLEKGEEYAGGGKVKFQDKVKAIKASLLKTKKVPKKVQKDYGKTYNAKEAELAAKRIAGAMAKKGIK